MLSFSLFYSFAFLVMLTIGLIPSAFPFDYFFILAVYMSGLCTVIESVLLCSGILSITATTEEWCVPVEYINSWQ